MPEVTDFQFPTREVPDFAFAFEFGKQLTRWLKHNPSHKSGIFLDDSVAKSISSEQTRDGLRQLLVDVQALCHSDTRSTEGIKYGFDHISFIEISLFDPWDEKNQNFYTLLWGPSRSAVNEYFRQLDSNLDLPKQTSATSLRRGPIIPNRNLYSSAFYDYDFERTRPCLSLSEGENLFFGAYKAETKEKTTWSNDLKSQIGDFFKAVGEKCVECSVGKEFFDHAILCPIVRPSLRQGRQRTSMFRGGGLFVYGQVSKGFGARDFTLAAGGMLTRSLLQLSMPAAEADRIREEVANSWGHEMNSVSRALNTQWAQPINISKLVEVDIVPKAALPTGRIAKVHITEEWARQAAIFPYYPFVETLSGLMSLWCMQAQQADAPVKPPESIRAIVQETWSFASHAAALFACRNTSLETLLELDSTIQLAKDITALFASCLEEHYSEGWIPPEICWDTPQQIRWNMTYFRLLMALFMNCVKHADPSKGIHVHLSLVEKQGRSPILVTEIKNFAWSDVQTELDSFRVGILAELVQNLKTPIEKLVDEFSKARESGKMISGYSSRRVIEKLVELTDWEIEGDLFEDSEHKSKLAQLFTITIRAQLPGGDLCR